MKIFKFGLVAVLILVLLAACQRENKAIGGKADRPIGSPKYSSKPKLVTLAKVSHVEEVAPKISEGPNGEKLYVANCSACHQTSGLGVPGAFPPLDDSEYVTGDNVERMAAIMVYGLSGPITVKGVEYNSVMAPLGQTLNNEELAAVATYIRSAWSNAAGPVETKVFEDVRAKWSERGPFTIDELGAE